MMRLFDPFGELSVIRREVDRVFDALRSTAPGLGRRDAAFPAINVSEDADKVDVEVLAPGLNTDELNISVQRNLLTISGKKTGLSEDVTREQLYRNERVGGNFSRTLTLPAEVDADKVKAEYSDGVLHIELPKAESYKPRKIEVSVG